MNGLTAELAYVVQLVDAYLYCQYEIPECESLLDTVNEKLPVEAFPPDGFVIVGVVGFVLSIFTVRSDGQLPVFPALSVTEPGDAVVVLVVVEYLFVTVADAHPLPLSTHVPVIVTSSFVQSVFPPLFVHVGDVLSIFTV